jgi:hypothetical protein
LLVLMDDTERTIGPDSETARVLADAIRDRLRAERGEQPAGEEVGRE